MARHRYLDQGEETPEINLSPMIDCIFILLIFFIVTTVFVEEEGLQIFKPEAGGSADPDNENIVLEVTADGDVLHEGQNIGVNGVRSKVRQLMTSEEVPVIIRTNAKANHGLFTRVWDEAESAGAEAITFNTVN